MLNNKKILSPQELLNKIGVVVGTRPGIIKMSPIIRALEQRRQGYFIAHTGQHYSYNLDRKFFEDLELPEPCFRNDVVSKATLHGEQTALMIAGLESAFISSRPGIIIVGGDANTNLAGALAARKLGIRVAHVEAGLRSNDWRMPEEHNRVMIDHISEYLFAPTQEAKENLVKDNVKGKIFVVGNTIVDAVYQNMEIARNKSKILQTLGLIPQTYFVLTLHREENVDSAEILKSILEGIEQIAREFDYKTIFPIHPRTKKRISDFKLLHILESNPKVQVIEPIGYLDFLLLLSHARLILTDSGGIQEECCILKVPCVTLRDNTERPETLRVGANSLGGTSPQTMLRSVHEMLAKDRNWENPFGDGTAGVRIVEVLCDVLKNIRK